MVHRVILALGVYVGFLIGLAGDTLGLWFGTEVILGLMFSFSLLHFSKMSCFLDSSKGEKHGK